MIPDKIYVCAAHPAPFWFSDKQIPNMIEYIRKDKILEILKDSKHLADAALKIDELWYQIRFTYPSIPILI